MSPDTPPEERKRIRGVVVEAEDIKDAKRKFAKLLVTAQQAVTAGEVEQFLDALDQRAPRTPSAGPTFAEFAEEWKQVCVEGGGLTESSRETDLSILKCHLMPALGKMRLLDITPRVVDRYIAQKRKQKHQFGVGYSAKSINNHLAVVHRVFEKAIEYAMVEKNPVTKRTWLRREHTPEDSENWWTPEEEAAAIATLERWREKEPGARLVILVQLLTGMRFGEIRALEKRDLDLNTPGVWVRRSQARREVGTPKNKRARFQVIPRGLAGELREWMLRVEGQRVFPGVRGGPLPNNSLNRMYRRLADEAGVRPISSHGARHTSGSSYAVMGLGQKMIAALLGHSDPATTARYTHVNAAEQTAALVEARWSRLVGRE